MTAGRLASLAMYDGGELAFANDALWDSIASRLAHLGMRDVPARLERDLPLGAVWSSEHLLFGQTCGYPFASRYRGRLRVVATPMYSAPGCAGGEHQSFVIVNARSPARDLGALRGSRAVINDLESMTGRHLLGAAIADAGGERGFFASVDVSGSHAVSLARVAGSEADVAAIDCVSYAHLSRVVPELVAVTRIVHRTRRVPSLPFVMSAAYSAHDAALVARALAETLSDPSTAEARRALLLLGTETLDASAYDVTLDVAARADRVFGGLLPAAR